MSRKTEDERNPVSRNSSHFCLLSGAGGSWPEGSEALPPSFELGGGHNTRKGQGKSGGYRTLIAFRRGDRAIFLYGFAKSDRENIDDGELKVWRRIGQLYSGLDTDGIEAAVEAKELVEVEHGATEQE